MKKYLLIITLFAGGLLFQIARADIYDSALVAWYNMDNNRISGTTLTDLSGSANTGTLQNGVVTGTPSKMSQAVTVDGVNDYIDIGKGSTLNLATTLSIAYWVKTDGSHYGAVISDYDSFGLFSQYTSEIRSSNKASYYFANFSGGATSKEWDTTNAVITANVWHHVVITKNGTADGDVVIYVDGVSQALTILSSGVATIPSFAGVGNTSIGRYGSLDGGYMGSAIDDVRIYNRILSAGEAAQLYLQGASIHFNTI